MINIKRKRWVIVRTDDESFWDGSIGFFSKNVNNSFIVTFETKIEAIIEFNEYFEDENIVYDGEKYKAIEVTEIITDCD